MIRIALPDWIAQRQYFEWQHHHIAYWQAGQGETLLLIHGFPTAAWDWQAVWPSLGEHHHLIAPDLLGFGCSDKPHPYRYRITEQAQMILALLHRHAISRCRILAHDYGDSVAQELISLVHEQKTTLQISDVTFLNGGLFPETHRPVLAQRLLRSWLGPLMAAMMQKGTLKRNFRRLFGEKNPPSDEEIDAFWALINFNQGKRVMPSMIQYMRERQAHRQRWLSAMNESGIPLRLINGVEDPISGKHLVERYRQLISAAEVIELAGVGHYPQIETPDAIVAAMV